MDKRFGSFVSILVLTLLLSGCESEKSDRSVNLEISQEVQNTSEALTKEAEKNPLKVEVTRLLVEAFGDTAYPEELVLGEEERSGGQLRTNFYVEFKTNEAAYSPVRLVDELKRRDYDFAKLEQARKLRLKWDDPDYTDFAETEKRLMRLDREVLQVRLEKGGTFKLEGVFQTLVREDLTFINSKIVEITAVAPKGLFDRKLITESEITETQAIIGTEKGEAAINQAISDLNQLIAVANETDETIRLGYEEFEKKTFDACRPGTVYRGSWSSENSDKTGQLELEFIDLNSSEMTFEAVMRSDEFPGAEKKYAGKIQFESAAHSRNRTRSGRNPFPIVMEGVKISGAPRQAMIASYGGVTMDFLKEGLDPRITIQPLDGGGLLGWRAFTKIELTPVENLP